MSDDLMRDLQESLEPSARRSAARAARRPPPFTSDTLQLPAWKGGWETGYAAALAARDPGVRGECQVCGTETDEHHPNCEVGRLRKAIDAALEVLTAVHIDLEADESDMYFAKLEPTIAELAPLSSTPARWTL